MFDSESDPLLSLFCFYSFTFNFIIYFVINFNFYLFLISHYFFSFSFISFLVFISFVYYFILSKQYPKNIVPIHDTDCHALHSSSISFQSSSATTNTYSPPQATGFSTFTTNPWPKSLPINTCKHSQKRDRKIAQ